MTKRYILGVALAAAIFMRPWSASGAPRRTQGQQPASAASAQEGRQQVDGIAVRIEDDIITESEVRELMAFQTLVDGKANPRNQVIQELVDQWIARGEAQANGYPGPSDEDVQHAFTQLASQYSSPQEFERRYTEAGLSTIAVHRLLAQELLLARFLDYRFRPAVEVTDAQVEAYYRDEFTPQLKARNQPVPSLDSVEETIREVLIQRAISDRATQWLDDTRERLKIEIMPVNGESAQP